MEEVLNLQYQICHELLRISLNYYHVLNDFELHDVDVLETGGPIKTICIVHKNTGEYIGHFEFNESLDLPKLKWYYNCIKSLENNNKINIYLKYV